MPDKRPPAGFSARMGASAASVRPCRRQSKKQTSCEACFFGGRWWIRTTEVKRQQIYSLPPLATREISHIKVHPSVDSLELVIGVEPTTC